MESPALSPTHRRGFLGRAAGALAMLAAGGARTARAESAIATVEPPAAADAWLAKLTGKHRQFFDATEPNDGFPFAFAMTFLNTNKATYGLQDKDLTAVVGLRHSAIPLALKDEIWKKYKLGEFAKVNDKATNAPAERNIFYNPHDGDMMFPDASVDKMLARGAIVTCCNVALTVLSGVRASVAGVTAQQAYDEWKANLIPGVVVVPSGVLAVNRAQEKGCTYCYAS
jgi:intracellular sulfur oxidation DsrE/DsrF family protein